MIKKISIQTKILYTIASYGPSVPQDDRLAMARRVISDEDVADSIEASKAAIFRISPYLDIDDNIPLLQEYKNRIADTESKNDEEKQRLLHSVKVSLEDIVRGAENYESMMV